MKKHYLAPPCLVAVIACGSPPPPGGSTPTSDTTAETKTDAVTADTTTADAGTSDVADTSGTDTTTPLDTQPDSADAQVPDGQPLTDAPPPTDLAAPDLPPADAPDTAKPDLPQPDTPDTEDTTDADGGPPVPGETGIGACTQNAPGWNSCIIQAFWQCIQPTATCVKQKQSELDFSAAWMGGGAMACKIDMGASTAICTGNGPDGKKCLDFVETFDMNAKTATAEVTGPNGKHTMTFQGDTISVKCADGKTEFYADDKGLCSPLKGEGCPKKDEPPPGPGPDPGPDPCPPLAKCKDASMCPPDYTCDGATNLCLLPCPVNAPCPPCTQCDPASNMCSPFAVPPPP